MSDELYQVEVQLSDKQIVPAKFFLSDEVPEDPELVKLTLHFTGNEISSIDRDYFSAMCAIRRVLEQDGTLLRCYGASRNVYPSGMSRSMGSGVKAYKLTMGRTQNWQTWFSIFDMGPDTIPATVAEQENFFEDWLKSLARIIHERRGMDKGSARSGDGE